MTNAEMQQEALSRARGSMALTNYPAVIQGFMEKGIAPDDIIPRVNVLTYNAWKALGRQVNRGEHGVHVLTWISVGEKKDAAGAVVNRAHKYPHGATVFHITQTEEIH